MGLFDIFHRPSGQDHLLRELIEEQRKLEPILNKAKDAIESVAKAHNFTYVFDASSGTLLYMGGEDVTKLVCTHLGLPDYSTEPEKK